jgi:hypothetical protein
MFSMPSPVTGRSTVRRCDPVVLTGLVFAVIILAVCLLPGACRSLRDDPDWLCHLRAADGLAECLPWLVVGLLWAVGRVLWAVVGAVAWVIEFGWRRCTEVDDRHREWQRVHAAACRERAAEYRPGPPVTTRTPPT